MRHLNVTMKTPNFHHKHDEPIGPIADFIGFKHGTHKGLHD